MKIGIDISSLQGAHRMRGIGYTTINFLENIPETNKDEYIFFLDNNAPLGGDEVMKSLNLQIKNYGLQYFTGKATKKHLPWKFRCITKLLAKLSDVSVYRRGDKRYGNLSELDAFIQFDQSKPLPAGARNVKKYFVGYDLIPYILEKDYLISYRTARQKGLIKRAALKSAVNRYAYLKKLKLNCKRADYIIAISETTKQDYIKYCGVPGSKISVVTLGVSDMTTSVEKSTGIINRYRKTSWGYIPRPTSLKHKNFLLFVGGADDRRRLHDLIAAFNHLKAQGSDITLVLSGDTMKGPLDIPTSNIQKALLSTSYLDDIYFVGFTDNATRNWLYKHATAFVFPSVYEGFGLPVLEAMSLGTPTICYRNRAVEEVASTIPFYAHDVLSLVDTIRNVQALSGSNTLKARLSNGIEHTTEYTWQKTAKKVVHLVHK